MNFKKFKKLVKRIDKTHIIERVYVSLMNFKNRKEFKDRLKINLRGVKRGKKVYIVRRAANDVGLFSYFETSLGGIAYADKNNMTPVVDLKNSPNTYLEADEVGKVNVWEYYFMQPSNLSLDDAYASRKFIIGRGEPTYPFFNGKLDELDYWRKICGKYIKLAPAVVSRVQQDKELLFKCNGGGGGYKILGVSCRGTDYAALHPKGHPVQPEPEQVIAKAQEAIALKNFEFIYLTTEDVNIIKKFQKVFGDKLILPRQEYVNYNNKSGEYVTTYSTGQKKYAQGLDYIAAKLLLDECGGLIASLTSGIRSFMCLSKNWNNFKYRYIFDLGVY